MRKRLLKVYKQLQAVLKRNPDKDLDLNGVWIHYAYNTGVTSS